MGRSTSFPNNWCKIGNKDFEKKNIFTRFGTLRAIIVMKVHIFMINL